MKLDLDRLSDEAIMAGYLAIRDMLVLRVGDQASHAQAFREAAAAVIETETLYVVRHWDGFDGEWIDISEPLPKIKAEQLCGDKNEARRGSAAGKREGNYDDIDYYAVFPADTVMHFSDAGAGPMNPDR